MTFFVQAPIFVWREHMRHRMARYNEESGRYRVLDPVFYVPGPERNLVQRRQARRLRLRRGTPEQHALTDDAMRDRLRQSYAAYQRMLDAGVAREVARMVLPVPSTRRPTSR